MACRQGVSARTPAPSISYAKWPDPVRFLPGSPLSPSESMACRDVNRRLTGLLKAFRRHRPHRAAGWCRRTSTFRTQVHVPLRRHQVLMTGQGLLHPASGLESRKCACTAAVAESAPHAANCCAGGGVPMTYDDPHRHVDDRGPAIRSIVRAVSGCAVARAVRHLGSCYRLRRGLALRCGVEDWQNSRSSCSGGCPSPSWRCGARRLLVRPPALGGRYLGPRGPAPDRPAHPRPVSRPSRRTRTTSCDASSSTRTGTWRPWPFRRCWRCCGSRWIDSWPGSRAGGIGVLRHGRHDQPDSSVGAHGRAAPRGRGVCRLRGLLLRPHDHAVITGARTTASTASRPAGGIALWTPSRSSGRLEFTASRESQGPCPGRTSSRARRRRTRWTMRDVYSARSARRTWHSAPLKRCRWATASSAAWCRLCWASPDWAWCSACASRSTCEFGELRPLYDSPYLRARGIHVTLVSSFLLGTVSAFLRANKALALTGIGFTLVAALLGGSRVAPAAAIEDPSSWLAVDFFVLNLLLYSAVFVPLERLFALRADQAVFRRHWLVDLSYFFVNSLLVEVLTVLTLTPALVLFDWARVASIVQRWARYRYRCRCSRWSWWQTSPNTGSTARSTWSRSSGPSTRFTTRSSRWTGWRGRGCTWWT